MTSLVAREIPDAVDTEAAFSTLFGSSAYAFWLDSSRVGGPARYSVLGASDSVVRGGFEALGPALDRASDVELPAGFPPELAGGFVGYTAYEADGVWMAASRFVIVDHLDARTWVVGLDAPEWVDDAVVRLHRLAAENTMPVRHSGVDPEPYLLRGRETYLRDIEDCLACLRAGESYEICLTNTVQLPFGGEAPFEVYRRLRRLEPAPYAAYLRIGDRHVLSASPERFLTVDLARFAESRPIKGTAPRGADPESDAASGKELAASTKTRAENLMIVDLLRNDLGRVCEPGTIEVPAFLSVESYATVHQLVSTVRGRLASGVTAVEAARACFPPGSMTGAPKPRTMQIIDRLEQRPRGVYSGALGWFGLRGTADLSVVIRTAVIENGTVSVGAGGAIVLDSDPEEEYAEMLLKAAVPLRAL